jgi:hypothetical protein
MSAPKRDVTPDSDAQADDARPTDAGDDADQPAELPDRDAMSILSTGLGNGYIAPPPGFTEDIDQ